MIKSKKVLSVLAFGLIAVSMCGYPAMEVSAAQAVSASVTASDITNVKTGVSIKYTGDVYSTSYGTGTPIKVSGTYTVSAILDDTSRKCRVQLKNTGWIMTNDLSQYTVTKDSNNNLVVVQNKYAENQPTTTTVKVGDKVKYTGEAYYTSAGGKSVKVSGTYTVAAISSDKNAKYNVQLKGIGWVSLGNTTPDTPVTPVNPATVKVGDKVKYTGEAYYTTKGGKSVKVSGTYTVAAISSDKNAKYNVQLKGIGWVSLGNTTPDTPVTPVNPTTVKVGDKIKYTGEAYYTTKGGKSVKVSGTYTVAAISSDKNAKYNVQLKGIGWVSLSNTTPVTSEIKVGDKVKYTGNAYYTSAGGKSVKVSGTYTVAAISSDKNAKYRVQLKGIGWVSINDVTKVS